MCVDGENPPFSPRRSRSYCNPFYAKPVCLCYSDAAWRDAGLAARMAPKQEKLARKRAAEQEALKQARLVTNQTETQRLIAGLANFGGMIGITAVLCQNLPAAFVVSAVVVVATLLHIVESKRARAAVTLGAMGAAPLMSYVLMDDSWLQQQLQRRCLISIGAGLGVSYAGEMLQRAVVQGLRITPPEEEAIVGDLKTKAGQKALKLAQREVRARRRG